VETQLPRDKNAFRNLMHSPLPGGNEGTSSSEERTKEMDEWSELGKDAAKEALKENCSLLIDGLLEGVFSTMKKSLQNDGSLIVPTGDKAVELKNKMNHMVDLKNHLTRKYWPFSTPPLPDLEHFIEVFDRALATTNPGILKNMQGQLVGALFDFVKSTCDQIFDLIDKAKDVKSGELKWETTIDIWDTSVDLGETLFEILHLLGVPLPVNRVSDLIGDDFGKYLGIAKAINASLLNYATNAEASARVDALTKLNEDTLKDIDLLTAQIKDTLGKINAVNKALDNLKNSSHTPDSDKKIEADWNADVEACRTKHREYREKIEKDFMPSQGSASFGGDMVQGTKDLGNGFLDRAKEIERRLGLNE
jgi:hypothetical protein